MSFKSFSLPYTIINFLFASLKLLTNCELVFLDVSVTVLYVPSSQRGPESLPELRENHCVDEACGSVRVELYSPKMATHIIWISCLTQYVNIDTSFPSIIFISRIAVSSLFPY
jgi:hypothetical protein